jgi:hypothetical protein
MFRQYKRISEYYAYFLVGFVRGEAEAADVVKTDMI